MSYHKSNSNSNIIASNDLVKYTEADKNNDICNDSGVSGASNTEGAPQQLRVRFRMITRQSAQNQFKATISSTSSSISSVTSSVSKSATPALDINSNAPESIDHSTSINKYEKFEYKKINETVCFYNGNTSVNGSSIVINGKQYSNKQEQITHITPVNSSYDEQQIPINIGLNCTNKITSKSTTKTFRLTEDLRSNIRLDITLKPTLSIRNNRLDASESQTKLNETGSSENISGYQRSMSCDRPDQAVSLNTNNYRSNCSSTNNLSNNAYMEVIKKSNDIRQYKKQKEAEKQQISINNNNHRYSRQRVAIPYHTSIPINSSITFKIRNLSLNNLDEENAGEEEHLIKINRSKDSTKSETNSIYGDYNNQNTPTNPLSRSNSSIGRSIPINNSFTSSVINKSSANSSRVASPFTFIETYSARRPISLSPITNLKKARLIIKIIFSPFLFNCLTERDL